MKRILSVVAVLAVLALAAMAETPKTQNWNALGVLHNAKYVYVTSYDGPQFSMNLLPDDRAAISAVQSAIEESGYIVVYDPSQADMVLAVQARPSSDVLAVYQGGRFAMGTYLWRAEAKNGLSGSTPVLVKELARALETPGATS